MVHRSKTNLSAQSQEEWNLVDKEDVGRHGDIMV
jgi:hypothetical protein